MPFYGPISLAPYGGPFGATDPRLAQFIQNLISQYPGITSTTTYAGPQGGGASAFGFEYGGNQTDIQKLLAAPEGISGVGGTSTQTGLTPESQSALFQSQFCFIGETPILMADGTEKPIEHVRVNDLVLSYDFHRKQEIPTAVKAMTKGVEDHLIVINRSLHVTRLHRFATGHDTWLRACELTPGTMVVSRIGSSPVKTISWIPWTAITVYNLVVGAHTLAQNFFVKCGKEWWLVHNGGGGGGGGGGGAGDTGVAADVGVAADTGADVGTDVGANIGGTAPGEAGPPSAADVGTDVGANIGGNAPGEAGPPSSLAGNSPGEGGVGPGSSTGIGASVDTSGVIGTSDIGGTLGGRTSTGPARNMGGGFNLGGFARGAVGLGDTNASIAGMVGTAMGGAAGVPGIGGALGGLSGEATAAGVIGGSVGTGEISGQGPK